MDVWADDARREPEPARIVVCGTHPIMRAGVLAIVERDPRLTVVGQASTTEESLHLAQHLDPAVLVVSNSPGLLDAAEISRKLARHGDAGGAHLNTVVLVDDAAIGDTVEGQEEVLELLHAGVRGVLPLQSTPDELASAIHAVASGSAVLGVPSAVGLLDRLVTRFAATVGAGASLLRQLTDREVEVLRLVAAGLSNRAIASKLLLSEATVKSHFYRLSQKLDLRDRAHAVILAYETGIAASLGLTRDGVPQPRD
jgi:DNA-binding NarL/FixJ family response regulator